MTVIKKAIKEIIPSNRFFVIGLWTYYANCMEILLKQLNEYRESLVKDIQLPIGLFPVCMYYHNSCNMKIKFVFPNTCSSQ